MLGNHKLLTLFYLAKLISVTYVANVWDLEQNDQWNHAFLC